MVNVLLPRKGTKKKRKWKKKSQKVGRMEKVD